MLFRSEAIAGKPTRTLFIVPPLPLAREIKVVLRLAGTRPSKIGGAKGLAGSRIRRSPGSASVSQCGLPVSPGSNSAGKNQWLAQVNQRFTVARRRRLFTVFPCTESQVEVNARRIKARAQKTSYKSKKLGTCVFKSRLYPPFPPRHLAAKLVAAHSAAFQYPRAREKRFPKSPADKPRLASR